MFLAGALALVLSQAAVPATPEQEARIRSVLGVAVEKMDPSAECDLPKPAETDFLAVVGAYEGGRPSTVSVAGQDNDTTVADVAIAEGVYPIFLALSSFDSVIWRVTGHVERVRQVALVHHEPAGVTGIPKEKVHFATRSKCALPYRLYPDRTVEYDVPILAMFGRRANAMGGAYTIYGVTIDDSSLKVDPRPGNLTEDLVALAERRASALETDFYRFYPAGIAMVDPRRVVASGSVEQYEVLPNTAGAYELEKSGALVPASPTDIRRWKDRAVIGGHVRADRTEDLDFSSPYRVTRPIRLPASLCGGHSLTFFVPSRDYVKGDPCHSRVYVDDGTVMAGN